MTCVNTFGLTIAFGSSFFSIGAFVPELFNDFLTSLSPFCGASGEFTADALVDELGVPGADDALLTLGDVEVETLDESSDFLESSLAIFLASFCFDSSA